MSRRLTRIGAYAAALAAIIAGAPLTNAQVGVAQVTFDVTLPANTPPSDTIYVAGNFQNWDPSATPLTRDSPTHASGMVTTTEGNALEFKFTRGSWEKVEKASDCSEVANRTATATNNSTITVTIANWADVCVPFYDNRATKIHRSTTSLGVAKDFYVYIPADYSASPGRRYPALYLFRGHETEWINKNQDSTRGGHNIIDVYEQLRATGQVGPMILVFPGISSDDNSVSGMVTNFKSPELTAAPGIGNGRFEDYLLNDVIGYVDANYRTVATKLGRGVDGFSLGGFMSAKIAAQHPELFKTVGLFDGTHFYSRVNCQMVDVADQTFLNAMFDPVFGTPRDTAFAALNNGPSLVCAGTAAQMQSMHWFVQYGPLSSEPNDANYLRGDHLMQKLTAQGVSNEITAVLEGGHNWATADEHMRQTLPLHWNVLNPATAYPLRTESVAHEQDGTFVVTGSGVPLQEYTVETTTMLTTGFTAATTISADGAGKLNFQDQNENASSRRFFRLVSP
ncbi:MAG TPA: alpha/beta hydrolase-fold protein [Chthoniobacterales bacterium]|nr:alpha/beta hydrolase-fold protein [Chthoniobacterales bacterium]